MKVYNLILIAQMHFVNNMIKIVRLSFLLKNDILNETFFEED